MSRPSMRSQPSRLFQCLPRPSWWCKRMAQGCRWYSRPPRRRLCTGQKRGTKQEAVVTGLLYDCPLSAHTTGGRSDPAAGPWSPRAGGPPRPESKELRATLEGKAVAMSRLVQRVTPCDGPHIQQRVALTDGAEALQQQGYATFRSTPWCWISSTPPSICGTPRTPCWGSPSRSVWGDVL
jgi:hypothetical protein